MRELAGFLIFVLAVYGLANAVAVLKIGRYFLGTSHCRKQECQALQHPLETRKFLGRVPYLGDLLYCPPCIGFWVGMAFSVWLFSAARPFVEIWWKAMIVDGLAASGVAYLVHATAERLTHDLDM